MTIDLSSRSKYFRQIWWAVNSISPIQHDSSTNYFKSERHRSEFAHLLQEQDKLGKLESHFGPLPFQRLGKYFETLVHFAIQIDPRYELVLKNHPIYSGKITIGEIDLIIRDIESEELFHWEIALKFYLQHFPNDPYQMIGPNGKDSLGSKIKKLESKQLPLGQHPSVIERVGSTPTSKLFLKGMLFHHLSSGLKLDQADPNAETGWWTYRSELDQLQSIETDGWSILKKPDWIGPSVINHEPEFDLPGLKSNMLESTDEDHRGICVAGYKMKGDQFIETNRGFIL